MSNPVKILVIIVIAVHFTFFVLEAILWPMPAVHNSLIKLLNNPVDQPYSIQALVLKKLFINQGFYNLFLVITGLTGLKFIAMHKHHVGYAFILVLCVSGTAAGIVLACTTKAYMLAMAQAVPAAIGFFRMYRLYNAFASENTIVKPLQIP